MLWGDPCDMAFEGDSGIVTLISHLELSLPYLWSTRQGPNTSRVFGVPRRTVHATNRPTPYPLASLRPGYSMPIFIIALRKRICDLKDWYIL
ncbi:unnamed protein product [Ranitomeya imitator]|uniref:Uncharacterized protein n=1 Tax=Ranitomeya imitator TaxID=111125 RepID=A0ABN9LLG6_9NEOB|nr:unnamed protein product [Ranitomeya imitator]